MVTVVLVSFVPLFDNRPAVVVTLADDGAVSVASTDASFEEINSADSRHNAVSDPELVAAVVSSSVSDFSPSGDDADDGGVDVDGVYAIVTVFVERVPAPAVDDFADVVIRP